MKNLEYFMRLPYRIEIEPIPKNKGGGYAASIPRLGKHAVRGDGETIEEALCDLEAMKEERLACYLEEGLTIPEPESEEDDYSGKFVLRIPKSLHRELAVRARDNNVSLNQFVTSVISRGLAMESSGGAEALNQEMRRLSSELRELRSAIESGAASGHSSFQGGCGKVMDMDVEEGVRSP